MNERTPTWDASQIKQPGWNHVQQAFLDGAREARANPEAGESVFVRAADGYTKQIFEQADEYADKRIAALQSDPKPT